MTLSLEYPLREAADVTDEIRDMVVEITNGWYPDSIDWSDVWDRLDNSELASGQRIDIGDTLDSPAQRELKQCIRLLRRNS